MSPAAETNVQSASSYAEGIRMALADVCERFSLAGSLRRNAVEFTDKGQLLLDFVAVPKIESERGEEIGLRAVAKDLLVDAIEGLDECGELQLLPSWPHSEVQLHNLCFSWGKVRIWLAKPETFGSVLLFRTGPLQSSLTPIGQTAWARTITRLPKPWTPKFKSFTRRPKPQRS